MYNTLEESLDGDRSVSSHGISASCKTKSETKCSFDDLDLSYSCVIVICYTGYDDVIILASTLFHRIA